jgi:glycine/D-amino acid oxidase-like deaminating enzyme
VVLALNGYSHSFGLLTDRVFPLYTYVSMTRPLSDREQATIGGERSWGVLGYDPLGSSIRRTRDQRLLVRNVFDYSRRLQLEERRRQEVAEEHRRILLMRFPMLDGVELEYVWGGIISMTRGSRVPFIGRLGPGLVTIAGYGGAGIAMSNIGGRLVADLLLDADSELLDDLQSLPDPRWVPPPPILGPVARLQLRKLHRAASAVY